MEENFFHITQRYRARADLPLTSLDVALSEHVSMRHGLLASRYCHPITACCHVRRPPAAATQWFSVLLQSGSRSTLLTLAI